MESLDEFRRQVVACSLLLEEEVRSITDALPEEQRPKDGASLARLLVDQGKLTEFQVETIRRQGGNTLVLGNYVLLDQLGQGGMGTVYKAVHRRMQRLVALKVLSANVVNSPELQERFQREVRAAARLEHPNIVTAYDADEFEGTHFLVMQYVDGQDLAAYVKRHGPLSVQHAVDCIVQAARGLQYAHDQGVVHRDIKPANLLLDKSGVVQILDMGLARIDSTQEKESDLTSTGAVMGTVDYMAPEQAVSTKNADARSDQYSLGLTLWYLLTGRSAYGGDSLMARLLAHRDAPIPSLSINRPDVPPLLEIVFQKMVAKQPDNRYATLAAAADALTSSLEEGATEFDTSSTGQSSDSRLREFLQTTGNTEWSAAQSRGTAPAPNVAEPWNEATLTSEAANVQVTSPLSHSATAGTPPPRWKRRILSWSILGGIVLPLVLVLIWGNRPPPSDAGADRPPMPLPVSRSWQPTPEQQAFFDHVSKLPPEEQVQTVAKKLQEVNPGYDGTVRYHRVSYGNVSDFHVSAVAITDLWPVRAFSGLYSLSCSGSKETRGKLRDLSQLAGMKLKSLICRFTDVSDLSPLAGIPLNYLSCDRTLVSDLSPLNGMPLTTLVCDYTNVSDITPLDGMPLTILNVSNTKVTDLSVVAGMPLTELHCYHTAVSDLSPLKGARLTKLSANGSKIEDLSVLAGMPLKELQCVATRVTDLSPLAGMPLERFYCEHSRVRDLTVLERLPLKALTCTTDLVRAHRGLLRRIPTLETINGRPAQDVLSESAWQPTPEQQAFFDEVTKLPPEAQVQAVAKKLQEVNPGFDGLIKNPKMTGGKVTEIAFLPDAVSDIWPVCALPDLKGLSCLGTQGGTERKLRDLSPLAGMHLTHLVCGFTQVADLSPLWGMELSRLDCGYTLVEDLSPLRGAPLKSLKISGTKVSDLSPLEGMPLEVLSCRSLPVTNLEPLAGMPLTLLDCYGTKITDLSPLAGMKLTFLDIASTKVSDLSPLAGMPLEQLHFYHTLVADLAPLKGAPLTVVSGNGSRIADLLPLAGMKLTELHCGDTKVTDLSAIEGMNLTDLNCMYLPISDLSPLKGMPLKRLDCANTKVSDLSLLNGMPLTTLICDNTNVADLSPLAGMKLVTLQCGGTNVSDLSPLAGMPLKKLRCYSTQVTDLSPLSEMPLTYLDIGDTRVMDLSPVAGAPIQELYAWRTLVSDLAPLSNMPLTAIGLRQPAWFEASMETLFRSSPTLKGIAIASAKTPMSPDEFWREYDQGKQAAMAFAQETSAKPVEEQRIAVSERLRARNAGLQVEEEVVIRDSRVVEIVLKLSDRYFSDYTRPDPEHPDRKLRDREYDLSPLLALTHLRKLTLGGGPFWLDLTTLGPLPLEEVTCSDDVATRNRDLFRNHQTLQTVNGQPVEKSPAP